MESSKQTIEQWQHAVDERIRAIVPVVSHFRELQGEVRRLAQRVEELEARLKGTPTHTAEASEAASGASAPNGVPSASEGGGGKQE